MARWNVGEKNGQWKGGRTVTKDGYVLIMVGKDHHLADVRGYAYEHRLVAERKLGRRLRRDEEVHHDDENKSNNSPGNLVVTRGTKRRLRHFVHHRTKPSVLKRPEQRNRTVLCACGCKTEMKRFDKYGRPRRFMPSHNMRVRARWAKKRP